MKKITAAFDGLKFANATLDYAIEIAKHSKSAIAGTFLEGFLYHSFNLFDMVGSQGISQAKLSNLLKKDKETRNNAVATFENTCNKQSVNCFVRRDESFAITDLLKESIFTDLTIIGSGETLNHFQQPKPTPFVKEFLAGAQSPVLVVPPVHQPIDRVVFLYDGHPASVFALKMFTYLFSWTAKFPVEIIYVSERKLTLPDENLIGEYARSHFDDVSITQLIGEPEDALVTYLKKASGGTVVVMGAYGRGAVSRMFSGSMANRLMELLDVPLFIAHNK